MGSHAKIKKRSWCSLQSLYPAMGEGLSGRAGNVRYWRKADIQTGGYLAGLSEAGQGGMEPLIS
jgi:hypothetical protein